MTICFWIIKVLITGAEVWIPDDLIRRFGAVIVAALVGAVLAVVLALQFSVRRYHAWVYWPAVATVSVAGTMAGNAPHAGFGYPYSFSVICYLVVLLVVILVTWRASERTLSLRSIDTPRREMFYWAAIMSAFALGGAVGHLTATATLPLNYLPRGQLIAVAVLTGVLALAWWRFGLNPVAAFWLAYVVTRPLGAGLAIWLAAPQRAGGLGMGQWPVTLALAIVIVGLVCYLAITRDGRRSIGRVVVPDPAGGSASAAGSRSSLACTPQHDENDSNLSRSSLLVTTGSSRVALTLPGVRGTAIGHMCRNGRPYPVSGKLGCQDGHRAPTMAAMGTIKMHAHEVGTDAALVRRLLAGQFPRWADLPIAPVASYGTDHAIYRLGDRLAARLPRLADATRQAAIEAEWLPRFAPHLPLAVPRQLAMGCPGEGYPFDWSVYEWLPGQNANAGIDDRPLAAVDLAAFITALRQIDTAGAPPRARLSRGGPLAEHDERLRRSTTRLGDRIDGDTALRSWDESLSAEPWHGPDVWVHGDLLPGNLLVTGGRLSAVIDFGCLNVGDPAADLQPAWNMFAGDSRRRFRAELAADDASWLRGRGTTLYQAAMALDYYRDTNPGMVRQASHALAEVLADSTA